LISRNFGDMVFHNFSVCCRERVLLNGFYIKKTIDGRLALNQFFKL